MRVARVVIVLVAVPVIAWLAVSFHDARLLANVKTVLASRHPTPGQIQAALSDVRSADTLADRTEPLSFQAALEIRAGHLDAARRIYEQIVRREPDTAEAWLVLAQLSQQSDPARAAEARAQVKRLDPLSAKRR